MIFKARRTKIVSGSTKVGIIHEDDACKYEIHGGDRLHLINGKKHCHIVVDITNNHKTVKQGEIALFKEVSEELGLKKNIKIKVNFSGKPKSIKYIKEKLNGKTLSYNKLNEITQDIVYERLTEIEISYFTAACYIHGLNDKETSDLTKAMIETGDRLTLKEEIVLDKHCTGGVAGNRTTMIVVPIIAAAGLKIPKTSSRSITSPAGTADTMEVLTKVTVPLKKMKNIVEKYNGCIVWGGAMNLAPSDDKIIKVEHPLSIDAEGQMLASILAKKGSVGAKYVLIDIPIGNETKVKTKKSAKELARKFIKIGKLLKMKMDVIITHGNEPIGNGIGPSLEAKDVLKVLMQEEDRPKDLEKKGIKLAGKMFEMCGKCRKGKGKKLAKEILESGLAIEKMREIIYAQGGKKYIKPENIKTARHKHNIKAKKNCKVIDLNNSLISKTARIAGAPFDQEAGLFIHKHEKERVKKGETIITLYANSKEKLKFAKDFYNKNPVVVLK
ncbi:AMP phosphorylase [Candidatus Woesearchaeota archaeon]|nr:AMP phosphorylase [Candidatus Woesearchaeota archaeon]